MLTIGPEESQAIAKVLESGQVFRYHEGGECERFEIRYAESLGVKHAALCASGSVALAAALAGLRIGPGDEVLVPAHTYMATALAVLAVGAIPVIVDIDESITLDPEACEAAVGPRTRAMIPVHMWGQVCDMDALMAVAGRHELLVVEDACQCVGGAYGDHPVGSIGQAGAMSFNYFKNMTCGEGGAVVTDDGDVIRRARCFIDPCAFFWEGSEEEFQPFSNAGARASEIQGAMLNAQLDRLPGLIETLRGHKAYLIGEIQSAGLTLSPRHSPAGECATALMLLLPSPEAAESFAGATGGTLLARTGRHTYTEWTCVLERRGAHHPDLDPFKLPQNRDCRMAYTRDLCPRSLEILHRTVSIGLSVHQSRADLDRLAATIREAAATVGA